MRSHHRAANTFDSTSPSLLFCRRQWRHGPLLPNVDRRIRQPHTVGFRPVSMTSAVKRIIGTLPCAGIAFCVLRTRAPQSYPAEAAFRSISPSLAPPELLQQLCRKPVLRNTSTFTFQVGLMRRGLKGHEVTLAPHFHKLSSSLLFNLDHHITYIR